MSSMNQNQLPSSSHNNSQQQTPTQPTQQQQQQQPPQQQEEKKAVSFKLQDQPQYRVFGSQGKGNGQFNGPYGIVSDQKNQQIIVSDCNNHRIQIFNLQGDYLSQFGSQGSNNNQFQCPCQLSVHPANNNLLVADSSNYRVQMFDEQGQFVTSIGKGQLELAQAVDCSLSTHHIVIADYQRQVHIYSNDGQQLLKSFCSYGNNKDQTKGVFGICYDDDIRVIH